MHSIQPLTRALLRILFAALLLAGCKDHHQEQMDKAGTPAPNQQAPTPGPPAQ